MEWPQVYWLHNALMYHHNALSIWPGNDNGGIYSSAIKYMIDVIGGVAFAQISQSVAATTLQRLIPSYKVNITPEFCQLQTLIMSYTAGRQRKMTGLPFSLGLMLMDVSTQLEIVGEMRGLTVEAGRLSGRNTWRA